MPSSSQASTTVLVVDEEIPVRLAIANYVRACGYGVIEAASFDEALFAIRTSDVNIDAVLCDAELKIELKRFGLAQWLRKRRTGFPVVCPGTPRAADAAAELAASKGAFGRVINRLSGITVAFLVRV